ncbi:hypothetical protein [Parasitella parasitica]|uniref:Cas12f1-like TNB domain-containing protein n=1 Tax=Parasitella parasitica TaxID=35722 RepID=A0A0B7NDQ4_9FUNG|nr:hypothetical protein [Parasitella parasitica]
MSFSEKANSEDCKWPSSVDKNDENNTLVERTLAFWSKFDVTGARPPTVPNVYARPHHYLKWAHEIQREMSDKQFIQENVPQQTATPGYVYKTYRLSTVSPKKDHKTFIAATQKEIQDKTFKPLKCTDSRGSRTFSLLPLYDCKAKSVKLISKHFGRLSTLVAKQIKISKISINYNKDSSIGEKKQTSTTDKRILSPPKDKTTYVKTRIPAYGNASFGTSMKGKLPAPTKRITEAVKKLSKDLKGTYFIYDDEYLTSQMCNKWKQRKLTNLNAAGSKRKVHAVLKCNSCDTVWNRDVMASKNIYYTMHVTT